MLSVTGSASIHPGYTATALVVHWIGASCWHYFIFHSVYQNVVVSAAVGVLNTFLSRVDNLRSANVSLAVLAAEDATMLLVWSVFCDSRIRNGAIFVPFLTLNIASCILGVVTSTVYIYRQNSYMTVRNWQSQIFG